MWRQRWLRRFQSTPIGSRRSDPTACRTLNNAVVAGIRKFVELGERVGRGCQQRHPVNWRNRRIGTCKRGVRPQPQGCLRHPTKPLVQPERTCDAQEPAECWGYGRKKQKRCCQQNAPSELGQNILGSPKNVVSNHLSACKVLIINTQPLGKISGLCQLMASLTGLPMRPSISTSVSMVNFAVFLFTTSDTRGRDTIRISAASACFK